MSVDPFAEAELRYRDLVEERRIGSLQARAFRVAVRDLAVLDGEGRRWMLGPEDGIWYRRERERWLQADPPRRWRSWCRSTEQAFAPEHRQAVRGGSLLDGW